MMPSPPPRSSAEANGPHLLHRLAAPLRQAGWSHLDVWDELNEEDEEGHSYSSIEMERSGFYIRLGWNPSTGELTVDDPIESWDWDSLIPPLFPLDAPLVIQLAVHASQSLQAQDARRAFAGAGLLDATLLLLPEKHSPLRPNLVKLILIEHVYDVIDKYCGHGNAGNAFASLGEEFDWRISSGLRTWPLIVPAPIPSAAARGIAEWCWRRESDVEAWHHKVNDSTMARANIAATRAVLPHVHSEGVDWPSVRLALTASRRRLADGRPLSGLFDEGWPAIIASIHREIDRWQRTEDELGPKAVLRLLTLHGSRTESVGDWWGSGWYETAVRRAVPRAVADGTLPKPILEAFPNPDQLTDAIAHGPDLLDDDLLRWTIRAVHDERRYQWQGGPPAPPALTFPDWATDQLAEILGDSGHH